MAVVGERGRATWRSEPLMRRWTTSVRPDSKPTSRYLPRRPSAATRSPRERARDAARGSRGARQPRVEDLDPLEAAPDEQRLEQAPQRLDLGQLGHGSATPPARGARL